MKQFFKFFTASCLGTIAALALLGFIFVGAVSFMGSQKPELPSKMVLQLTIDEPVPEKTGNIASASSNPLQQPPNALGLRHIKRLIDHAATDSKVKGILIKNNSVSMGQASLTSLRESVENFKASGKFVYAYSDYMSQSAYYLASVADSVFLNPQGSIDIKGFGTLLPFFKEMLDDIGVKMEVFYAGNFKSATEPFRGTEMSPYNELQTREFLDDMLDIYQQKVATSRGLSVENIDNIMSNYDGRTAKKALEVGLIDKIAYIDEVESLIRKNLDIKDTKKIKYRKLAQYDKSVTLKKGTAKDRIAIIYAEGDVTYGSKNKGEINESTYLKYLEKAKNNDKVKAVVLRVNSGGGSSLTSDIIWRAVEKVKEAGKPVIASFGNYAASGGYYIACGADTIVSEPNTLTGSIGVFSIFPNVSELMNEKLGIHFDTVKTNPMAIGLTPMYDLSEKEETLLKESVDEIYETFLQRVAEGRHMSKEAVHEVAQGRVWTGKKAQQLGLIDQLGGLQDAIEIAAETANLEKYKVIEYPTIKETFLEKLMKSMAESDDAVARMSTSVLSAKEQKMLHDVQHLSKVLMDKTPQSRLPFILKVD